MSEMKGTPITRSGGYLIRVGWGAIGYSVDRDTESHFRRAKMFLLMLAIAIGVAVAMAVEYTFFAFIARKASEFIPAIKLYPELWRLLIYLATLMVGGLIYLQVVASVGKGMVKGRQPFDKGCSLFEQRQRTAYVRRRVLIPMAVALGVVMFVPLGLSFSLKLFLSFVLGGFMLEGLYFRYVRPVKHKKS